jgi:hypothetical protein
MTDEQLPVDEELEAAARVMCRMGGQAINQARRYLKTCTDDEIMDLATCEDGRRYRELMDQISDRHIAEEAAAKAAEEEATPAVDPAPPEEEAPATDDD